TRCITYFASLNTRDHEESCSVSATDWAVRQWTNYHNNYHEDRRWKFSCKPTFSWGTDCFLSPYVNDFDKTFSFECPPHHVIAGISSYHDNYHEDRRWQFSCCRSKCTSEVRGHCHSDCHWTSYVNSFDEYFFWTVPTQRVLVGIGSYHDDIHEDRRWRELALMED
uniref:Hemagglutinin/amebocyte aggregation factor n=1 Tax=Cyprinus carpio carpio TaxID=630221 RepID=A0A8C1ERY6_CYPCA